MKSKKSTSRRPLKTRAARRAQRARRKKISAPPCAKSTPLKIKIHCRSRKLAKPKRIRIYAPKNLRNPAPSIDKSKSTGRENQIEFPSLDFPGRQTLYPFELAARLGCCIRHVQDLITEGKIRAIDVSGAHNASDRRVIRIPIESWRKFISDRTT